MKRFLYLLIACLIAAEAMAATAATTIKLRGDTSANWTSRNPVLAVREPGVETDTRRIKIGDGSTAWNTLPYAAEGSGQASFPSWMPSTGPTPRQIIQADGGCSDTTYATQATCEANSGTWTVPSGRWTSIIEGLINDAGTGTDDLWSAANTIIRMTAKMAAPGTIGGTTPGAATFTNLVAGSFDFGAPATGQTGELGLQEDPANGNNIVTLKAPAALANDLIITLPTGVVPSTASDNCIAGQWWYDASYWYVCVAASTWRRAALATW